jgi:hypothetical protein
VAGMAPALVLILFGLLGPLATLQWREGRWLRAARWTARRLSPQLIAGVPMAGILVMTIGLSIVWPPGIILVFLAAAGFLWAVFAVAQPGADPEDAPVARPGASGQRPGTTSRAPRSGATPDSRSAPGTPRGTASPRPRSP